MKKYIKKGISLMSLVVTIAVVLILTTTITVSFNTVYVATKKKDFANEIYNIQKLVDMYYYRNEEYPVVSQYENMIVDLSQLNNEDKQQFANETDDLSSILVLKRLDLYETGVNESKNGHGTVEDKDIYCVSEKTGLVYYIKGKRFSNDVYYTLTEELKSQLGL